MKTHFLDFTTSDGQIVRGKFEAKKFQFLMDFSTGKIDSSGQKKSVPTAPRYGEKMEVVIDLMKQSGHTFTMADFTGRAGKIKTPNFAKPLPPEPEISDEERAKISEKFRKLGEKHFGKNWRERVKAKAEAEKLLRQEALRRKVATDNAKN